MTMKRTMLLLLLASASALGAFEAAAMGTGRDEPPPGHTYALVVGGISKDPNDRFVRDRILTVLQESLLNKAGVDRRRLIVLAAGDARLGTADGQSTADKVEEAMNTFASTLRPEDRFILYYTGQANAVAETLRFNLPGPDMTGQDVARRLRRIEAKTHLVVLDCPCAALAAKAMAGQGRIVVCASTEAQAYSTRFSLHFIPALVQPENDTDADGKVSVLEAFTAAAREIEQWYRDRAILPTETPCLEDNADGIPSESPWRYTVDGADGLAASSFFLAMNGK